MLTCTNALKKGNHCVNGRIELPIEKFEKNGEILKRCADCRNKDKATRKRYQQKQLQEDKKPVDRLWVLDLVIYGDGYMIWLQNAILEYIKNNPDKRFNSQDICSHFRLRVDITLEAIKILKANGLIHRHNHFADGWNGNHYYEVI